MSHHYWRSHSRPRHGFYAVIHVMGELSSIQLSHFYPLYSDCRIILNCCMSKLFCPEVCRLRLCPIETRVIIINSAQYEQIWICSQTVHLVWTICKQIEQRNPSHDMTWLFFHSLKERFWVVSFFFLLISVCFLHWSSRLGRSLFICQTYFLVSMLD